MPSIYHPSAVPTTLPSLTPTVPPTTGTPTATPTLESPRTVVLTAFCQEDGCSDSVTFTTPGDTFGIISATLEIDVGGDLGQNNEFLEITINEVEVGQCVNHEEDCEDLQPCFEGGPIDVTAQARTGEIVVAFDASGRVAPICDDYEGVDGVAAIMRATLVMVLSETFVPSTTPTPQPTPEESLPPTTPSPSAVPTAAPTFFPTPLPSFMPTKVEPTPSPSVPPTSRPTGAPSLLPSPAPTPVSPSPTPGTTTDPPTRSAVPTYTPTSVPTASPSLPPPSSMPSKVPTSSPTVTPTFENPVTLVETALCQSTGCSASVVFDTPSDRLGIVSATLSLNVGGDLSANRETLTIFINGQEQEDTCDANDDCTDLVECLDPDIDVLQQANTGTITVTFQASEQVDPNCDYEGFQGVAAILEATLVLELSATFSPTSFPPPTPEPTPLQPTSLEPTSLDFIDPSPIPTPTFTFNETFAD